MTQAGVKLLKTLRQILYILNALLTISAVVQIVDLITLISLKSKPKRKIPKRLPGVGNNLTLWSLSNVNNASVSSATATSSSSASTVSFAFLAGDIAILVITVIVGWMAIVTFKRKLLHTYLILMIVDMLFTVAIIIRDASTGSWLIMLDINLAINISTLIVLYFLYKELAKNSIINGLPSSNGVLGGLDDASLPRVHSNLEAFATTDPGLTTAASAASALGNTFESIDDSSTDISALASYLHHRRATIWSNGSLICETNLPASTYWDNSVCLTVAPLPYTIAPGEPPPPWSPPIDASVDPANFDPASRDTNNNSHLNNFNLNEAAAHGVLSPPDERQTCNSSRSSSSSSSSSSSPSSSHLNRTATASEETLTPSDQVSSV